MRGVDGVPHIRARLDPDRSRPHRVALARVLSHPQITQDPATGVHDDVRGHLALPLPGEPSYFEPQLRRHDLVDPGRQRPQTVGHEAGAGQEQPRQRTSGRDIVDAGRAAQHRQRVQHVVNVRGVGRLEPCRKIKQVPNHIQSGVGLAPLGPRLPGLPQQVLLRVAETELGCDAHRDVLSPL